MWTDGERLGGPRFQCDLDNSDLSYPEGHNGVALDWFQVWKQQDSLPPSLDVSDDTFWCGDLEKDDPCTHDHHTEFVSHMKAWSSKSITVSLTFQMVWLSMMQ